MIPKIIHQTWKDSNIPSKVKFCVDSWKLLNPKYEYKFWTDQDIYNFINEFYPELCERLNNFKKGIIKADFFRLLVLYHYGGIYADLDFECLKPIEKWKFDENKVNVGCEPKEHINIHEKNDYILCNALIISPPQNQSLFRLIIYGNHINDKYPLEVMNTYGPLAWTKLYKETNILDSINIIKSELLYPLPDISNPDLNYNTISKEEYEDKIKNNKFDSYAIHYWDHCYFPRKSLLDKK